MIDNFIEFGLDPTYGEQLYIFLISDRKTAAQPAARLLAAGCCRPKCEPRDQKIAKNSHTIAKNKKILKDIKKNKYIGEALKIR